jgi:hypothetical protein
VTSVVDIARRRWEGTNVVDPWGLDHDLVSLVDPLMDLRWSIAVDGADGVPAEGPAVVVANRRFGISEPLVLGRALRRATGRTARILGVPDVAPIGPVLRRIGGAVDRPEELAALLRAGELVMVGLGVSIRWRHRAGSLDPRALEPALRQRVPVLPAAVIGQEYGRAWRVVLGEPLALPAGAGPLAVADLAESARAGVQTLLDEALPPRWLLH